MLICRYNFFFNLRMIESEDEKTPLSSPLTKTKASHKEDSSNQKDFKLYTSDRKLHDIETLASSMKSKRKFLFSETKSSSYSSQTYSRKEGSKLKFNPQSKQTTDSQQKQKQTTTEEIINKTLKLTNEFYNNQIDFHQLQLKKGNKQNVLQFNKNFKQKIINVLKNLKYKPKEFINHLNSIYFSSPSIRILQFAQIQKQILKQWRENILLTSIRYEWFNCIQQYLPSFGNQGYKVFSQILLEQFCDFLGYITYSIFKLYFVFEIQKQNKSRQQVINKLSTQTMRYIVTQSSQWQNVVFLSIQQILRIGLTPIQINNFTKHYLTFVVINQMKVEPFRNLLDQKYRKNIQLFPQTKSSILKFIKQHFSLSKIKCITNIRVALEQDILTYQKQLIQKQEMKQFQMFQKDGMITCLIIAILSMIDKKHTNLEHLQLSLKQVRMLLGQNLQNILGVHKCPSYFTDLEAALDFIYLQIQKNANLEN